MGFLPSSQIPKVMRLAALIMLTAAVWLVTAMVYFDRFLPPFDRLVPWLMPWKSKGNFPEQAGLGERISFLQIQLDESARVAAYAFWGMIVMFALLSVYLTVIYQQKQMRLRENRFLMLKNREIARRNEFIRYISATIGHEFKNNLGRIKRRIDLLPGLPEEAKARIDGNLHKLFADIDIFKKISDEREAGLVDFARVDLRQMLAGIADQLSDLADVRFEKDGASLPPIYASRPLLKTVFENVFDNAIKYKKPDQPRARIRVSCDLDNDAGRNYVSISLRDEGIGMDEQQADQCFYKGRGSGDGWGQGLYFAKYVVGLHAGKIRLGKDYTSPGRGTEFIVKLPLVEETLDV
jgi:signal transduction histidine kinase